jgi:hypothetical protein
MMRTRNLALCQEINELLDTTTLLCQEIADQLQCDVKYVNEIVHRRFLARVGESL